MFPPSQRRTTISLPCMLVLLLCASNMGVPPSAVEALVVPNHARNRNAQPTTTSIYQQETRTTTALLATPSMEELESSYGEQSRPYRRDFFTHDSWVRHRSPDRFTNNLLNLYKSGVVRQLIGECVFIGFTATFICAFNAFCSVGYEDFSGLHHEPFLQLQTLKLPMQPFTLSSPALGLLLVFRTNACYQRWDEARKAWGVVVNNSRTIARQTSSWIKYSDLPLEEKQILLKRTRDTVWAFPRTLARHLLSESEDEENYCKAVKERLDEPFATELIRWKRHRPSRALFEMSNAINQLPLETYRRIAVDQSVSHLCDAMGGCDRIYTSPIPSVYTRHTARFLEIWVLFLPLCLWNVLGGSWNHIATIPVAVAINYFLLGIEELSIQLEEPFSILPLHKIAESIGKSADEHFGWNEREELKNAAIDTTSLGGGGNTIINLPTTMTAVAPPVELQSMAVAQAYASPVEISPAAQPIPASEIPPYANPAVPAIDEAQISAAAVVAPSSYESLAESWKAMNAGQ